MLKKQKLRYICIIVVIILFIASVQPIKSIINSRALNTVISNNFHTDEEYDSILQNTTEKIFDVTVYGALGDDKTDDGKCIQNAFDACNSAGGGIVYFPDGVYCISKTVFYYGNQKIIFSDNAILKRIENSEDNKFTVGVFLCNWFLASDTSAETSKIACENVEIVGGTFDANGAVPKKEPHNVAMINTCHVNNIYIHDCKFINNYNAHCIEINSSENVEISNCSFSDYKGSENDSKYNEMVQIDKSVNQALGSYIYKEYRTIEGYYNQTNIDNENPDCKGSGNINIHDCIFVTNKYCSAIGNHHKSDFTTINNGIKIYNCSFYGTTTNRGYIVFDEHTENIEIYDNTFSGGKCGVSSNRVNGKCLIFGNEFENCDIAYRGVYVAFGNKIDGKTDAENIQDASVGNTTVVIDNDNFFYNLLKKIKGTFLF